MAAVLPRLVVAAAALVATLSAHARIPPDPIVTASGAEILPKAETAHLASLGFDAVLADLYWLRAVQVVGREQGQLGSHATLLADLSELVVALDPWVDHPYRFAALWVSEFPETVAAANRILERGIAYHPLDWRNRFYLSFNHFFYRGDMRAAARELEPALGLAGAPRYLGRLLARLRSETDSLDAAADYLAQLVESAPDGYARAEYEKALDEIETERRARLLDAARELHRARHGRDIAAVEDLVSGPDPVLPALPPELHGWGWVLDAETGRIESAYYGHRYRLHLNRAQHDTLEQGGGRSWGDERRAVAGGEEEEE